MIEYHFLILECIISPRAEECTDFLLHDDSSIVKDFHPLRDIYHQFSNISFQEKQKTMSETGEKLEEASTDATKPKNDQSSLTIQYFSVATGSWEDTPSLQPGREIQEGPRLDYDPRLEQSSSYFSLSSGSSAALSAPANNNANANANTAANKSVIDNPGVVTPGNEIQEGRNTIESSAKIPPIPPRKDSDDISLSKIKPVHNFFGQHPYTPYDSDGSDGSLVFSPGSYSDDHKSYVPSDKMPPDKIPSDKKDGSYSGGTGATPNAIGKRNDSTTPTSSRTRFGSVDSVASNGSIRYVRPSPVNASASSDARQSNGPSQPINPQLLPYNERRKLIQQRQYQEQHQQYQQYHAAMMQAQFQASQQQQQQQGHPSHPSGPQYPIDPRMAQNYYQMYGTPPPGMYAPMPPHHNQHQSGGAPPVNGYPYVPPMPAMPYYHMPNSTGPSHGPSHTQLHPSIQQFQHQSSTTGYQPQPYPSPLMPSHQVPPPPYQNNNNNNPSRIPPAASPYPSMPPQYAYLPPPPPPPPMSSPEQTEQREKQIRYEESQKPPQPRPDRSRNSGKDTESNTGVGVSISSNSAHWSSPSAKNANVKNNSPRLPPTATRRGSGSNSGFNRDVGSSNSIPPPPSSLSSPKSNVKSFSGGSPSYHSRADSYGSMSSLGSQGFGSGSFSKDEDDDYPQSYAQPSQHHPETQQSTGIDNQNDSNLSKPNQPTIDTSIAMNTPETPRQSGHARKNSFLDRLRMNWSPQSRNSPISSSRKVNKVREFHRKNQEFLNRATALPPTPLKSPTAASIPNMQHRHVGSQDRPPASRGTHRRLQSISNDEWEEGDDSKSSDNKDSAQINKKIPTPSGNFEIKQSPAIANTFSSDGMSESETFTDEDRCTTDDDVRDHNDYENVNVNEFSSLLPPSGISSNEQEGKNPKYDRKGRRGRQNYEATSNTRRKEHNRSDSNDFSQILGNMGVSDSSANVPRMPDTTVRLDNRTANTARKGRKKKYRHKNSKYVPDSDSTSENSQDSSDSDFDHRKWTKKRSRMLDKERAKLIEQWRAEAREEAELLRKEEETNRWYRRMWNTTSEKFRHFGVTTFRCLTLVETFIGNLPLTIGAVALAIVTLGVVWFKFAEEYLDSCQPVHFHSSQCNFPEFPGCFYCDKSALGYKIAIGFHYACTIVSGLIAMLIVAKVLLATRVVIDEMSSPTTSSPAGLLCMTSVCVFAGRGMVGQVIVSAAACCHLALAIWFIYMALAYNIMPEPSWFPNTIGIGISAVKVKHSSNFVFRLHDMIDPHHRLPCYLLIRRNNLCRRFGCIIQCEFNVFLFLFSKFNLIFFQELRP